ncbi:MAG: hypothetical protein COA78_28450 [Blastopirellula sp.]|nr:MAG: hypothetical protein COA78_28450 [Blastopirellula sp.]
MFKHTLILSCDGDSDQEENYFNDFVSAIDTMVSATHYEMSLVEGSIPIYAHEECAFMIYALSKLKDTETDTEIRDACTSLMLRLEKHQEYTDYLPDDESIPDPGSSIDVGTTEFFPWVKKLGQAHWYVADDGVTLCEQPMLGSNYATRIDTKDLQPCTVCTHRRKEMEHG